MTGWMTAHASVMIRTMTVAVAMTLGMLGSEVLICSYSGLLAWATARSDGFLDRDSATMESGLTATSSVRVYPQSPLLIGELCALGRQSWMPRVSEAPESRAPLLLLSAACTRLQPAVTVSQSSRRLRGRG